MALILKSYTVNFVWRWRTWNVKWINATVLFMTGRKKSSELSSVIMTRNWSYPCLIRKWTVCCFSCQCSQRPQLPGLHPTVEQPKWVPVHPPCLEERSLRPLHGPHLLPDGLLLRQSVSRRGNLTVCGWTLLQLVLKCGWNDYNKRQKKNTLTQDELKRLTPKPVSQL